MTPLGPKRVYYEEPARHNWRRPIETGEDYDILISEDGDDLISEDGSDLIPEDAAF